MCNIHGQKRNTETPKIDFDVSRKEMASNFD